MESSTLSNLSLAVATEVERGKDTDRPELVTTIRHAGLVGGLAVGREAGPTPSRPTLHLVTLDEQG